MQIKTREAELRVDGRPMRTVVVSPKAEGRYPGILLYSEIFQLTPPIRRSMERLAGHGFLVAAPEIYHRIEPPGLVIPYDDAGRMRGQDDAARTTVAEFDADRVAVLDFLESQQDATAGRLGAMGFCIGGHLAFRAALDPRVKAAVCCYPTGLHIPEEGRQKVAATLAAAGVKHRVHLAPGEHAFMRDEGPRFDPEAADEVWQITIEMFRKTFS